MPETTETTKDLPALTTEPKPESPAELAARAKRLARKFAGHSALPIATAILQGKYDTAKEQVGIPITQELLDLDEAIEKLAALATIQASQEPVAWCELTPSGKIAYFDGKPMVVPGPVGNDCHTTPLYTAAAQARPVSGEAA